MTVQIMAWNRAGEARIFNGRQSNDVETQADTWGAVRFEDALGGIFRKIQGEWVFLRQRKTKENQP